MCETPWAGCAKAGYTGQWLGRYPLDSNYLKNTKRFWTFRTRRVFQEKYHHDPSFPPAYMFPCFLSWFSRFVPMFLLQNMPSLKYPGRPSVKILRLEVTINFCIFELVVFPTKSGTGRLRFYDENGKYFNLSWNTWNYENCEPHASGTYIDLAIN
jgi:hypothetical protein